MERRLITVIREDTGLELPNVERFSQWRRLIRSTAWILLLVDKCRKRRDAEPQCDHVMNAEMLWIKKVQADSYGKDIKNLETNKKLSSGNRLLTLTPMLDKNGILRLDSRIRSVRDVEADVKTPIILDSHHPYTRLLVQHYHQKLGHGSTEMVINELRQKYWIT